ncbi:MAG: hypothetical protein WBZ29_10400 [Methanocella sp.]
MDEGPALKYYLFDRAVLEKQMPETARKAAAMGSFIAGSPVRLKECCSMVPLIERKPGGMMAPLKGQ